MLALTFQVGPDRVAVDVRRVHEVVPRVRLTPATGGPAWVAGVFVYRGRVVPVIDLHRLTGAGECPPHLSSRIILIPHPTDPDALVGLLATQVADIRELPEPPARGEPGAPTLGPAIADGTDVLRLLDPDRFLPALGPALTGARP
ncbi:MAG TPA: chemotaxis protein CheW [Gemmataceae bacterium]|nr:chemotaxis protein CheW [Gemmataceae bacterium]